MVKTDTLREHIDAGLAEQNGRGYDEFIRLLTKGDEFGEPVPILKFSRIFNRSRMTIERWILRYCVEEGIPYPKTIKELMR